MTPKIKKVRSNPDYTLTLTFPNRKTRKFDMKPYLKKGIFKKLKEWNFFRRATIALGTVTWPGGLDIAPETLYWESVAKKS